MRLDPGSFQLRVVAGRNDDGVALQTNNLGGGDVDLATVGVGVFAYQPAAGGFAGLVDYQRVAGGGQGEVIAVSGSSGILLIFLILVVCRGLIVTWNYWAVKIYHGANNILV